MKKQNIWQNNYFVGMLSIVIIVAIVLIVMGSSGTTTNDSSGKAYDIYSYQEQWTERPIIKEKVLVDPSPYYIYMR